MSSQTSNTASQRSPGVDRIDKEAEDIKSVANGIVNATASQRSDSTVQASIDKVPDRSLLKRPRQAAQETSPVLDGGASEKATVYLPLDIWILVAEHLDPLSLLHMTRVNRSLRALFTSKRSSQSIWTRLAKRLKVPTFRIQDSSLIALFSFLCENVCAVCGDSGADCEDGLDLIRYHEHCQKELLSDQETLAEQLVLHPRATECVGGPESCLWNPRLFLRSEIIPINEQLQEGEKTSPESVRKLVNMYKRRLALRRKDEYALMRWLDERIETRDNDLRKRLGSPDEKDFNCAMARFKLGPFEYDDQEWLNIAPSLGAAVAEAKKDRQQAERRSTLTKKYENYRKQQIAQDFDIFPPFSTFVRMDFVKQLWEPESAAGGFRRSEIEDIETNWTNTLLRLAPEVEQARRWLKICYVRKMVDALGEKNKLFGTAFLDALKSPAASIVANGLAEIKPESLDTSDPATISTAVLDEVLLRYSTQAWKVAKLLHTTFFEAHRQASDHHFPWFNVEWHRVLLHVLEATDISDGPLDVVASTLKALGHGFFCGQCSWRSKGTSVSVLLHHVEKHLYEYDFDTAETPLIVYQDPSLPLPPPSVPAATEKKLKSDSRSKSKSKAKAKSKASSAKGKRVGGK